MTELSTSGDLRVSGQTSNQSIGPEALLESLGSLGSTTLIPGSTGNELPTRTPTVSFSDRLAVVESLLNRATQLADISLMQDDLAKFEVGDPDPQFVPDEWLGELEAEDVEDVIPFLVVWDEAVDS